MPPPSHRFGSNSSSSFSTKRQHGLDRYEEDVEPRLDKRSRHGDVGPSSPRLAHSNTSKHGHSPGRVSHLASDQTGTRRYVSAHPEHVQNAAKTSVRSSHTRSGVGSTTPSTSAAFDARNKRTEITSNPAHLEDIDYDFDLNEEDKTAKVLEESRKRRQAILEKYRESGSRAKINSDVAASPTRASTQASASDPANAAPPDAVADSAVAKPAATDQPETSFRIRKESSDIPIKHAIVAGEAGPEGEEVSAADLDPDADRAAELAKEQQRRMKSDLSGNHTNMVTIDASNAAQASLPKDDEYEEIEVTDEDEELDMFALDDADVAGPKRKKKVRVLKSRTSAATSATAGLLESRGDSGVGASSSVLQSNWDDADGYLRIILGESLDEGRYQIFANLGKGMFASVAKARDLHNQDREVAIKIIRVQETMYKAGLKEIKILRKLNESDPHDKKHIIRLERHFDYKGHLCMVFESLSLNLRDVVRRFGKDVGLNTQAVRTYAHQLFLALSHLEKNGIMHADIKPDNILVNETKTVLKLCDLGSASDLSEMEITPYLVSRFYRAPEIILGQAYDCSIDVWSAGCTLYELATGKILFPGKSNNHMLLLMQELKGKLTSKQLRKSQFAEQHFDQSTNTFLWLDASAGGGSVTRKVLPPNPNPTQDLRARLLPGNTAKQLKGGELRTMNLLIDFLSRCLELDPTKRITPKEALTHGFLSQH